MITTLDRYILRSLLTNYLIALGAMICLYIVLDMFVNMDEFTEHGYPLLTVLGNILDYYGSNIFLYFAQLSGIITLFACLAVLARMRQLNEMVAILASGVSLYRVAAPIIAFGLATTLLGVADTEWAIPSMAHRLARKHDDVHSKHAYEVLFLQDRDEALLSAGQFHPTTRDLHRLLVLRRSAEGSIVSTLEADRAEWEPPGDGRPMGRWRLERGRQMVRLAERSADIGPREDKTITYPQYYESELSPAVIELRQAENWIRFLSLRELAELEARDSPERASIIRTRHGRVAAPIVNLVLLLLGLPFFLDRSPANVISDAGRCMVLCGLCYVATFVALSIRPETQSALPAWIPIFIFGTLAVVLLDRVRT